MAKLRNLEGLLEIRDMPELPAPEPCAQEVGIDKALLYPGARSGRVCKVCRWELIECTEMADAEPRYFHGYPVPPLAKEAEHHG